MVVGELLELFEPFARGVGVDLEFVHDVWIQAGESGEAIWQLLTTASPPFKALAEELDPGRRARACLLYTSPSPRD